MEALHAPWRIQYILGPKKPSSGESIFTRIAQSGDDVGNHVVSRGKTCYAVLNTYPYNGGHLLIVPYKQTADLNDLTPEELCDLMLMTRRCQNALVKVMNPQGFNLGMNLGRIAGAGVDEHLHLHIVPRWSGDTNFMPVLGQTAVLAEALEDVARKLREALAADLA